VGINSFGQVIGTSDIVGDKVQHSFLYSDGRMLDLTALFPNLTNFIAAGINDAMRIIGSAVTPGGLERGLIVSAVPEPDGGLLALAGLAALGVGTQMRRARRPSKRTI